jgi:hypothetical protein
VHVLAVVVGIAALAACNALFVPLRLEQQIALHARTPLLLRAHEAGWFAEGSRWTDAAAGAPGGGGECRGRAAGEGALDGELLALVEGYRRKGCQIMDVLQTCGLPPLLAAAAPAVSLLLQRLACRRGALEM